MFSFGYLIISKIVKFHILLKIGLNLNKIISHFTNGKPRFTI